MSSKNNDTSTTSTTETNNDRNTDSADTNKLPADSSSKSSSGLTDFIIVTIVISILLFVFYVWTIIRAIRLALNSEKRDLAYYFWWLLIIVNILGGQFFGLPFLILAIITWSEKLHKKFEDRINIQYQKGFRQYNRRKNQILGKIQQNKQRTRNILNDPIKYINSSKR